MPNSPSFLSAESLTLIGALSAAVGVLWRAVQSKDRMIQDMIRETMHQTQMIAGLTAALDRLRVDGCAHGSTRSSGADREKQSG